MPPYIKRRTLYAREQRNHLRSALGNKCARCQQTEHLQFDCIKSRGGEHHEMNWRQRLGFYHAEHLLGNLQLLCPRCHVAKTLADIAARHMNSLHVTCPECKHSFKAFEAGVVIGKLISAGGNAASSLT